MNDLSSQTKRVHLKNNMPKSNKRFFDITEAKYNDDGVVDFYWPLDNEKTIEFLNILKDMLIPFITRNENKYTELVAIRILFKWFICEVLRLFEATVIAEESRRDGVIPIIPKKYKRLDATYNSKSLKCDLFLNHSSGPFYGRRIPRIIKRFVKEIIWNGFRSELLKKYGSNSNDILSIVPSNLTIKHANETNKLLRFSEFEEWFGPISSNRLLKETKNLQGSERVLSIVKDAFSKNGYNMSPEILRYLSTWINQANNFVNFHLQDDTFNLNKIKTDVWFGCGGNTVWHVIFIEKLRNNGIKVVTHDHGSGNSYQANTPSHWVEYMHTDHFVTFNSISEKNRRNQFNSDLIFSKPNPLIQSLDSLISSENIKQNINIVKKSNKIKKIMYVGTAYLGEGARTQPICHDITYFDWQVKLLSFLKNKKMNVTYKPHPEGSVRVPSGFAESFGFQTRNERFEEITDDFDAYIIDFIFSSTTPAVLKTDKPVIFIDIGCPKIVPEALKSIKKRCYYIQASYSNGSRLNIDWDNLYKLLDKEDHVFDMSFPDAYFRNV